MEVEREPPDPEPVVVTVSDAGGVAVAAPASASVPTEPQMAAGYRAWVERAEAAFRAAVAKQAGERTGPAAEKPSREPR